MKQKHYGISSMTAAIVGTVIGIGLGVAGTIAVSNKNNQNKVKGVFKKAKNKVTEYVENSKAKIQGLKEIVDDEKVEVKNKTTKILKKVKALKKKE